MPESRSGRSTPKRSKVKEEEQQKQDEEKLRAEEEQEKERLIQLEKKRIEKERLEELARTRPVQRQNTKRKIEKYLSFIHKTFESEKYDFEFKRFTRSGNRPDPMNLKEINTYISILKESGSTEMEVVMADAKLIVSILDEINLFIDKYLPDKAPSDKKEEYLQTISNLQSLIMHRYNCASLKVLQTAALQTDTDSGNLQKVYKGKWETLMLWGNLNKSPRLKGFEFDEENFTFEIPKNLTLLDIGVRILITKYDHYSSRCSTFNAKPPIQNLTENKEDFEVLTENEVDKDDEKEVEEKKDNEEKDKEENLENEELQSEKPLETTEEIQDVAEDTVKDEDTNKEETEKEESLPPKQADKISLHEDEDILDVDVIDLRQFTRLGDIIHIELIEMPPQPTVVNGWTLTQILDTPLTHVTYPMVTKQPADGDKQSNTEINDDTKNSKEASSTFGVTFKISPDVMLYEEPQIALWDETDEHWKTSTISDVVYDDYEKTISFRSTKFGAFCMLQDTHLNMPFQSWDLYATGKDSALFTVTAACSENIFEIKGSLCRLLKAEDASLKEFEHIYEKWKTPEELIAMMKKAGNNIFPSSDSVNFVSVPEKAIDCNFVYDQMAYLSPSFGFAWSKFSSDIRDNQLILQMIPLVELEERKTMLIEDKRANNFLIMPDRCYKLAVSEQELKVSYQLAPDLNTYQSDLIHAAMYTPLSDDKNDEILSMLFERINKSEEELVTSVRQLLRATDVLSFS